MLFRNDAEGDDDEDGNLGNLGNLAAFLEGSVEVLGGHGFESREAQCCCALEKGNET